jgi:hypothetical protein
MKTLRYFEKSVTVFLPTLPEIPEDFNLSTLSDFRRAVDQMMVFIWEGEVSAG